MELTYPLVYSSEPGVTLMKATEPAPSVEEQVAALSIVEAKSARQFPLAGQTQSRPLEGKA